MKELEQIGGTGEPVRLFPVLSESSKEGRTLSILLASMAHVPEFANAMLSTIGRKVGVRASLKAYTEVCFPKTTVPKCRPDGLLVVSTGKSIWRAFIEAKVGTAKLTPEQIEMYLTVAREVGVDAVITISNDFTSSPEQHPVEINRRLLGKTELYHFSWFSFLTALNVLSEGDEVGDRDHQFLLDELERFLIHPSAGLQRFTQMTTSWTSLLDRIRSGLTTSKTNDDVISVVESWHSELRDLCLLTTRKTGAYVDLKLPTKLKNNPSERLKADAKSVAENCLLSAALIVPNAATTLELEADLASRTLRALCQLDAPKDRVRQASRLNWILAQLEETDGDAVRLQSHWPGRAATIESSLEEARVDPSIHTHPDKSMLPHRFAVLMRMADGRKFIGRNTFIAELESLTLDFYDHVLCRLKAWQQPAPKLRKAVEEKTVDEVLQDSEAGAAR
jgi:hypothetical protein